MARKRKSSPRTKKRSKKQSIRDRYSHAREDAQLFGLIETTPEVALEKEQVDPASQGQQPLPNLIRKAICHGWAVPESEKPGLVNELIVMVHNPEIDPCHRITAFTALTKGDEMQYERDYPEAAGKAKGTTNVNVGVGVNIEDPTKVWQRLLAEVQRDEIEERIEAEGSDMAPVDSRRRCENQGHHGRG